MLGILGVSSSCFAKFWNLFPFLLRISEKELAIAPYSRKGIVCFCPFKNITVKFLTWVRCGAHPNNPCRLCTCTFSISIPLLQKVRTFTTTPPPQTLILLANLQCEILVALTSNVSSVKSVTNYTSVANSQNCPTILSKIEGWAKAL